MIKPSLVNKFQHTNRGHVSTEERKWQEVAPESAATHLLQMSEIHPDGFTAQQWNILLKSDGIGYQYQK